MPLSMVELAAGETSWPARQSAPAASERRRSSLRPPHAQRSCSRAASSAVVTTACMGADGDALMSSSFPQTTASGALLHGWDKLPPGAAAMGH